MKTTPERSSSLAILPALPLLLVVALLAAGRLDAQDLRVGDTTANNTTNFSGVTNSYNSIVIGNTTPATNNLMIVSGANTYLTNFGYPMDVGNQGSANTLVISNGGFLGDGQYCDGIVGTASNSSNNLAVITGTGSTWQAGWSYSIGQAGSENTLIVSNGGTMTSIGGGGRLHRPVRRSLQQRRDRDRGRFLHGCRGQRAIDRRRGFQQQWQYPANYQRWNGELCGNYHWQRAQ